MSQPVPESASNWLNLFSLFLVLALIAGGIVVSILIYYIYKYRYKEGQPEPTFEPSPLRFRVREAIILASLSGIMLFGLAIVSYKVSSNIMFPPSDPNALTVNVYARQWQFNFTYPNNKSIVDFCYVPAETTVIFNVTSIDVFHNFALPDFRLKVDAIPGVYNTLWIKSPGLQGNPQLQYDIRCYELCGTGHSFMSAKLVVQDNATFTGWLTNSTGG